MKKSEKNLNNKKLYILDLLKGWGIFLVSLGHSNCLPSLRKYIYAYHMPLFYFASGVTFKPDKFEKISQFIKYKFKKIMLPYIYINLFTIPIWYIYTSIIGKGTFSIFDALLGILIGNNDIHYLINGPTWFLPTLFVSEVLLFYIVNYFNKDSKQLTLAALFLIIFAYVESMVNNDLLLPWHLNCVPMAVGVMIFGYLSLPYFEKMQEEEKNHRFRKIIISILMLLLAAYLSVYLNGKVSWGGNNYKSIFITFSVLYLSLRGLIIFFSQLKWEKILQFLGANSIIVLAIHKPIIMIFRNIFPFFKIPSLKSTILAVLLFIIILPLTALIAKYARFIIGDFSKCSKRTKNIINLLLIISILLLLLI